VVKSYEQVTRELAEFLAPYRRMLEAFVGGSMSADEFETAFLAQYKSEARMCSDDVFNIVDSFFADVDRYVGDPDLRARLASDALGPVELRELARELVRRASFEAT
jgi:Bacterial self-protective colicin-like immunity